MLCTFFGIWCAAQATIAVGLFDPAMGKVAHCATLDSAGHHVSEWAPRADGLCYSADDPSHDAPKLRDPFNAMH